MSKPRKLLPSSNAPNRLPVFALAAALMYTLLAVFLGYHLQRAPAVSVGELGDGPFLSGFYADEADINYRYRWTGGQSRVSFAMSGSAPVTSVIVRAQGLSPEAAGGRPISMTVGIDGQQAAPAGVSVGNTLADYRFALSGGDAGSPGQERTVTIDTGTVRPPGDARQLGVKVDSVTLVQAQSGPNFPPLAMLVWPLVLAAGIFGLLSFLRSPLNLLLPAASVLLLGVPLLASPLYVAEYLPPVAAAVGVAGLLVLQRGRLARWPEALDALRGRPAFAVMAAALLLYGVVALWTVLRVDWIGHADYAENAVIARNIVEGRGLTVDYMAQFYRDYGPGLSHPADTWPLLQPLLTAPFFALLGPATPVAKLPNLFALLALALGVFLAGSRLWDGRVGLLAGLLTLAHPYFFNSVLYPINDLVFAAIFFALAWLLHTVVGGGGRAERSTGRLLGVGALAGLLIWSKPSGAALLGGLALWLIVAALRNGNGLRALPWRRIGIAAGAFAAVLLPLVVRNLLAFGAPFYSTESYDAWLLRYWPLHEWEEIYKVYQGRELPHPRWIVGGKFGYENLLDAVALNFRWVWQKGVTSAPSQGDYVLGPLYLLLALIGVGVLDRRALRLFGMVGLSLAFYALFVLLYWHFEGRYFQVAVPWLLMLAARAVLWVWDRLRAETGRARLVGVLFLPVAVVSLILPSLDAIGAQIESDTAPVGFVGDMEWLRANSAPGDVIMTRDPWEVNWYTRRKAVMIPFDDLATIESTARKYGATMLQLGGPVDGVDTRRCPGDVGSRPALDGLYCGQERPGYTLVYRNGGLTVYRLTPRAK